MKNFRGLQKEHKLLLKMQQSGRDIVESVEKYVEVTNKAGLDITNSFQREQLRANNRYWGNYIYEKTGVFPKTEIELPSETAIFRKRVFAWLIRGSVLLLIILLFANLYLFFLLPSSQPTYEVVVPLSICTPDSPLVNVYNAAPQAWVNAIFNYAFPPYIPTSIPPNTSPYNEQQILSARYAAFQQLVNETKRWSDVETIKFNDLSETQIIVTFISPELFQAVFLNEALKDRSITSGIQDQLQKVLNPISERNELLFLITITATNNDVTSSPSHIIRIPISQMVLVNSEGLLISPAHYDPNLNRPINSSSDPVFGYIGYPLRVFTNSECKWILDPKYNTNIVLTVPYIGVDGIQSKNPYFWTIPYAPLLNLSTPSTTPIFSPPPGYDQSQMAPSVLPPKDINQPNYWQDFSRFVWNQVTLGNY